EENGLLEAFRTTAAGGDSALFDKIFNGLNFGPTIGVVNGTSLTASQALRQFSGTRTFLANGNVQGFADYLNQNSSFTGEIGGLLRRAALPENFIVTNPQFGSRTFGGAAIVGNLNNSTYHSMQLAVTKRLSQGFTNQTTYVWSRSIGTTIVDPRYRSTKTLQNFHRTQAIRSNGTWQLPFGSNQLFLGSAPGWVSRLVERWQLGGIFTWNSGAPLNLITNSQTPSPFKLLPNSNNFPDLVGPLPKDIGKVKITSTRGRITYFEGLQRITDPGKSNITTAQNLQTANGQFAQADAQGRPILVN